MDADVSVEHVAEVTGRLERELAKAIVGQQRVIREIRIAFLAGGHVLLRGVPGLAKTLLMIKKLASRYDSGPPPSPASMKGSGDRLPPATTTGLLPPGRTGGMRPSR